MTKTRHATTDPIKPRPLDERQEYQPKPLLTQRQKLLLGAVSLTAAVSVIVAADRMDEPYERHADKMEQLAEADIKKGVATVEPNILVLGSETRLRTEPARIYDHDGKAGDSEVAIPNYDRVVGEDQALVIDRALRWTDKDGDEWAGFTITSNADNKTEEQWRWVNLTGLKNDGVEVSEYRYIELGFNNVEYDATFTENGISAVTAHDSGAQVAIGLMRPHKDAIQFAMNQTGDINPAG